MPTRLDMGKRSWLFWSSVVLASTLLSLILAGVRARSLARAEQQRNTRLSRVAIPWGLSEQEDLTREITVSNRLSQLRTSSRVVTPDTTIEMPEVSSLYPGFLPPDAGERDLLNPYAARDLPRGLRDSLKRLESAKRIEVTWSEPRAKATLQQAEGSFRLTTVSLTDPTAPANVITVVENVAYIEDHGDAFSLPVARFQLPVDRNFILSVSNVWWKALAASYRYKTFRVSVIPGGAAITEINTGTGRKPTRYTVADGSYLTSFEISDPSDISNQRSKITYEFATSVRWKSIEAPAWAATPTRAPMTWDEALPQGEPGWIVPVVLVTKVDPTSGRVEGSQCGSPPFTPNPLPNGVPTLPTGVVFRCQINLADVPSTIGFPSSGLLQFFTADDYTSSYVRHLREIDASTHSVTQAIDIPIEQAIQPTALAFVAAHTADSWVNIQENAPRPLRYLRHPSGYPLWNSIESDPDFLSAMARRGVNYVANDVNLMGGRWDANGATPEGYTRLFMIPDDVGYAYWHIPTADLATGRFDRVVGGWTD
jgi:hypothetical protein